MKFILKNFFIILILVTGNSLMNPIFGQDQLLKDKLSGLDRLDDIMEVVTAHYEDPSNDLYGLPRYKHWVRWAYEMSGRTIDDGRLVDVRKYVGNAWEKERTRPKNRMSAGNWSFVGPFAISGTNGSSIGIGRVDRIAFHPTDVNTFYIGTPAGGLMKTTNGGGTWIGLTDNFPSVAISGIVVSHANPDHIYVLTGDGDSNIQGFVENAGYLRGGAGVFVSYDAGVNWYPVAAFPGITSYVGYDLVQSPVDANVLLAATDQGVFRTANGGASWVQEVANIRCYDLAFQPGGNRVYLTNNGTFRFQYSDNGGQDWDNVLDFDPVAPGGRIAIAVTNAEPNNVYLLSGTGFNGVFGGLYLSEDSGESFVRVTNTPNIVDACCDGDQATNNQSNYDLALAVNHNNPDFLATGAIRIWRSVDGGVTMINATPSCNGSGSNTCNDGPGSISTGFVHADVHMLAYNPLNNFLYACTDGGVHRSVNNGFAWTDLADGITASQIYHMAGTPEDEDNLMIGLQDNGVKRRNANSTTFDHVLGADGFDIIYNVNSATTGYFSWNTSVGFFFNNGANWSTILDVGEWFGRVTSAIDDATLVLAGYSDIRRSTNAGTSWTNVGAEGNWDIERCPSNSLRYYAAGGATAFATTGNFYFSSDRGQTWTAKADPGTGRITDIAVTPDNSAKVFVAYGGFNGGAKVYRSINTGDSWENWSGSLPNVPVNALAVDANDNIYAGTDIGVYYRGANMSDWVPFSDNLPVVPVTDIELYDDMIRIATFGKGVWESELYSTCWETYTLSGPINGHQIIEVSDRITTSAAIYGGANTDVLLKAGNYIQINPGFVASFATRFQAYTKPCGSY